MKNIFEVTGPADQIRIVGSDNAVVSEQTKHEYLVAADLLDDHGFGRAARVLRESAKCTLRITYGDTSSMCCTWSEIDVSQSEPDREFTLGQSPTPWNPTKLVIGIDTSEFHTVTV